MTTELFRVPNQGMFLKKLHELLIGEENFYDEIFEDLQLPVKPVKWRHDNNPEDLAALSFSGIC